MNFMDRVGIGNARLYGMEEELGLVGNQFQLAVSVSRPRSAPVPKHLLPCVFCTGLQIVC
jgi:hypothetical protein